ncbi:MAG: mechanosensitive ion channel [Piscinibacter sp.]|nr:mechanosensitive ion channel [Piscinibacter sp.]
MDQNAFLTALQASLGSHIPQILGAIAIFAVGWLIAVLARAATRRLLSLLAVNRRIEDSTGAKVDAEFPVAVGVFWLVILGAVIAALTALDLSALSTPFSLMLTDIVGYLPHLVAGLVLALVAWLIATVLRAAAGKALSMTGLDDKLSAAAGMAPMSRNVGNVLFWLVMLLFLPSILGAFRLEGTLGPVQTMLGSALEMLPNVFAAAVIGFVGFVVARVLRGLVVNLLAAAGADTLSERAGLDGSVKFSRLAGTLVFILVLVPSLIAALDALKIEAVSRPATLMLGQMLDAVPHLIAAAVILLITYYVARFASVLLARLLESAGFDALPARLGLGAALSGPTRPSQLAQWAVMFFAMLFAAVEAAAQLGFAQVRDVVTTFIGFAGDIVLGGLILAIGFWLANLAYDAIDKASGEKSAGLAAVARIAILGVVIAMGLRAMGIANEIVQLAFALTFGAVAVAVALSFGLGGREAAGKLMEHWTARWRRD